MYLHMNRCWQTRVHLQVQCWKRVTGYIGDGHWRVFVAQKIFWVWWYDKIFIQGVRYVLSPQGHWSYGPQGRYLRNDPGPWTQLSLETSSDCSSSVACVPTCSGSRDDQEQVWGNSLYVLSDVQLLMNVFWPCGWISNFISHLFGI